MNRVHVYFDVVSPWSKVAFSSLRRYEKAWQLDLDFTPVNQGYLMDYSGNKAPMTVPNKGMWMMQHDLPRASRLFDVPLILHDNFPAPTFRAQALLRIIKDQDRARFLPAVETLFESTWGHSDVPLATLDNLKDILRPLYRQEEAKLSDLIAASNSQENKARMKQEAQDLAESKGAFGVPWIIVTRHDGEEGIFFGSDRLEQLAAFLHKPYLGAQANGLTPKL